MITLAMLIALGRPHEIRVHVKGAIANGVTKEQISEIIMHSSIYCGVPAAVDGYPQRHGDARRARARVSSSPQDLRVGFVGLGNMGAPMVRNLAKAGFALTLHDADEERAGGDRERARRHGGRARPPTSRAPTSSSRCCRTTARSRPSCSTWEGGIASALRSGAVVVDMSSSNPAGTIKLGDGARGAAASASSTRPSRAASPAP